MMKSLGWLLLGGLLVFGLGYVREHRKQELPALLKRLPQAEPNKLEATQTGLPAEPPAATQPMVTVVSPLAQWMGKNESGQLRQEHSAPRKPLALDHIALSPVGSTNTILHSTFAVRTLMKVPFEIPAHAATPRLHGTFQSFAQQAPAQSSDDSGNVDFLVLNEQQYAELATGRQGQALFSAESTHDQEVNLGLPVSRDQPQKYYLVFRNSSSGEGKKLVRAHFTVDF